MQRDQLRSVVLFDRHACPWMDNHSQYANTVGPRNVRVHHTCTLYYLFRVVAISWLPAIFTEHVDIIILSVDIDITSLDPLDLQRLFKLTTDTSHTVMVINFKSRGRRGSTSSLD